MISFDAAHAAVHYPPDRRFRVWIRPSMLITAAVLAVLPVLAAWTEVLLMGVPHIPPVPQISPNNFAGSHGFPLWVRYCHFFNFLFVMMLIRSGLSILADHPPRSLFYADPTISKPTSPDRVHSAMRFIRTLVVCLQFLNFHKRFVQTPIIHRSQTRKQRSSLSAVCLGARFL